MRLFLFNAALLVWNSKNIILPGPHLKLGHLCRQMIQDSPGCLRNVIIVLKVLWLGIVFGTFSSVQLADSSYRFLLLLVRESWKLLFRFCAGPWDDYRTIKSEFVQAGQPCSSRFLMLLKEFARWYMWIRVPQ